MLSRLILAITVTVFVVAGAPAYAKGPSKKECTRACDGGINACMSSCGDFGTPENFHRTCKKAIIKGCKREGTEFCRQLVAPITTTTTPGATTTTTTTTPGATTTTTLMRFVDNGDGTITDNQTGLMWEKKSDDDSIHDVDNVYTWSKNSRSTDFDGTAYDFLATLNSGSGFAGYTDWRLPEVKKDGGTEELDSLVDLSRGGPPYILDEFNSSCTLGCPVTTCSCTAADFYWSSTTYAFPPVPEDVWVVNFGNGYSIPEGKDGDGYVRAVRDVPN